MRSGPLAALLAVVASCPTVAAAGPRDRHDTHKQAAYAAFELGKYSEAITQFERAYQLKRDPRLLYNIALAYYRRYELFHRSPDLHQARHLFRRFLLLVAPPGAGPDRRRILDARRYSEGYLKKIDAAVAKLPPREREPVRDPTVRPASQPTAPGAPRSMATSRPASGPTAATSAVAASDEPPSASTGQRAERSGWQHWLLYGAAATIGAAAAVTGGLALAADARSDELAARGDEGAVAEADRTENLALATDVLIGAAVVAGAVAVILHLRHRRDVRRATLLVGSSVGLRLAF